MPSFDHTALAQSHPLTVAAFKAMVALPSLAAVAALDRRWQATERGMPTAASWQAMSTLPPTEQQFDLVYAGGSLGLLHAAVMALRYGYRVLVFDRGEIGCAHREWNLGENELPALLATGLLTAAELDAIIMRRYEDGVVRFSPDNTGVPAAEIHLPGVLNVALDATALLQHVRAKLQAAGGVVLDHHSFAEVHAAATGVAVTTHDADGVAHCWGARLLIDGMGAASPLALQRYAGQPFAGICPTVGTVVEGLLPGDGPTQHNPAVGDILVSVAGAQGGKQLIWEGFAGRDDELTVYVFYYDLLGKKRKGLISAQQHSLLDLFEEYFARLPEYKQPGLDFRHIKPVYGFIPARHTERRSTALPLRGVLPVGDAGAQQSPLTFCGFGSHVRNLQRTTDLLDLALRQNVLAPRDLEQISAYQANVALHWVFSRFMQPWRDPNDVNRLQNVFARVLNELGNDMAIRFFQDQMRWGDYGRIVNHTLKVYRRIVPTALTVLGPHDTLRWIADYGRFCGAALQAAVGRLLGASVLARLERRLLARRPAWAFRLRARRHEWRAMGWVSMMPDE